MRALIDRDWRESPERIIRTSCKRRMRQSRALTRVFSSNARESVASSAADNDQVNTQVKEGQMQISFCAAFLLFTGFAALTPGSAQVVGNVPLRIAASPNHPGENGGAYSGAQANSLQGLRQYQQQRRTSLTLGTSARQPEKSCRIDPKTGCHFGHIESSHPGGCLCTADRRTEAANDH